MPLELEADWPDMAAARQEAFDVYLDALNGAIAVEEAIALIAGINERVQAMLREFLVDLDAYFSARINTLLAQWDSEQLH
ncbi:MAG TPA: hypothetical protein VH643_22345 [Gemmataceae bacterium]|jgi:hypothetical protein